MKARDMTLVELFEANQELSRRVDQYSAARHQIDPAWNRHCAISRITADAVELAPAWELIPLEHLQRVLVHLDAVDEYGALTVLSEWIATSPQPDKTPGTGSRAFRLAAFRAIQDEINDLSILARTLNV